MAGRKRLTYTVPVALRPLFDSANEIDSVTVIERRGRLYSRVALTREAPDPRGIVPVGVDLMLT